MIKFISAEELKKEFTVYGHFYTIEIESFCRIECRSVLEIISAKYQVKKYDEVSNKLPDAIFIMMNPGSSKPLTKTNNLISSRKISDLQISLVLTKPDTTQYQLMRVMKYLNWQHIRVINLSDLRDAESGSFIDKYMHYEKSIKLTEHSIFSKKREKELTAKLKRKNGAPIVCAWGINKELDALIKRCLSKIKNENAVKGLLKKDTTNKYYHPLPTLQIDKEKWVKNMINELKT